MVSVLKSSVLFINQVFISSFPSLFSGQVWPYLTSSVRLKWPTERISTISTFDRIRITLDDRKYRRTIFGEPRSYNKFWILDKVPLALLLGKNPLQLSTDLVTVYKENEIIAIFWEINWSYRLDILDIRYSITWL